MHLWLWKATDADRAHERDGRAGVQGGDGDTLLLLSSWEGLGTRLCDRL